MKKNIAQVVRILEGCWHINLGFLIVGFGIVFLQQVIDFVIEGMGDYTGILHELFTLIPLWFLVTVVFCGMYEFWKGFQIITKQRQK